MTPREKEAAERSAREVPNAVKKAQLAILAGLVREIEALDADTPHVASWGNVALAARSYYNLCAPFEHPHATGAL